MIAILAAIGHWCASCVPASVGVAPALGALGGAAAAAAGISGLGDLANDGGTGDVSGAPSGAGSGAGAPSGAGSDAGAPSAASDAGAGLAAGAGTGAQAGSAGPDGATTGSNSGPSESGTQSGPEPTNPTPEAPTGPFESPGWIDNALGLNPNTSFVQAGMDGLGYGPTGIWGHPIAPGESALNTAGRALGAAAVAPLTALAAAGGDLLDNLNHGPELGQIGGELSDQLGGEGAPNPPSPATPATPATPAYFDPKTGKYANPLDNEPPTGQ
jgi:hypothetical protein